MKSLKDIPTELLFWTSALILLSTATPQLHGQEQHFTLCLLANMGLDWCPGCGIGRAITQLLHGNVAGSLAHHWFGIPALLIICWRIGVLMRINLIRKRLLKLKYKEKSYV